MSRLRLAALAAVVVLVAWIRFLPFELSGAERGAAHSVRAEIAAQSSDVDQWISQHPSEYRARLDAERRRRRELFSFEAADGRRYPFVGGFDSYMWLRAARNRIETGSGCDAIVDGRCRDELTLAPVGVESRYARLLPVAAVANTHRLLSLPFPDLPLSASGYFVSWLLGTLGAIPAFLLGSRFGGTVGGVLCAVLAALNTSFLYRSFGADNDVWNVVLPIVELWAVIEALYAGDWRRRWLLLAVAATAAALHALAWSGWLFAFGVLLAGLAANLLLHATRWLLDRDAPGNRARAATALSILVGYVGLISVALVVTSSEVSPVDLGSALLHRATGVAPIFSAGDASDVAAAESAAASPKLQWPNVFLTVGELSKPSLPRIAAGMGGPVYFFVAWLGMLLLILPRKDWEPWHYFVLISGNLLYRYLLTRNDLSNVMLIAVLLIPLAVGVGAYLGDRDRKVEDQGAGLLIILWFLAALFMAFGGTRFLILMVPPLAILNAVALGRLYDWLCRQTLLDSAWVHGLVFVALLAAAYPPAVRAFEMGSAFLPVMNSGWHAALTRIRSESAADSIVNTWWDYGYFAKYFADRRVLSDGGTLRTHVHHWVARALLSTDPVETVGILRMLNCGSDAFPEPEGEKGALGRLLAAGLNERQAYAAIVAVAGLGRVEAASELATRGLSSAAIDSVLERTHCTPAPGYLMVPEELLTISAVYRIGAWRPSGAPRPVAEIWSSGWRGCRGQSQLSCEIGRPYGNRSVVGAIDLSRDDPSDARVELRRREGQVAPDFVVVLAGVGFERLQLGSGAGFGVVFDPHRNRALAASTRLLDSVLARLVLNDLESLDVFEPFDSQPLPVGELRTYRIRW